jgi:uncharacterized membrane protein HdeD (DUF308 family)
MTTVREDRFMSTVDPAHAPGSEPMASRRDSVYEDATHGDGWVLFAGVMLAMLGTLNFIDGVAAVSNSTFFVEGARFVLADLNTWGWILLITGVTQLAVAFGVWYRATGIRWIGVGIAALNAIVQLIFIDAYPFWSLTLFTLDILVIYGLVAYGARSATR